MLRLAEAQQLGERVLAMLAKRRFRTG
jgi:hypothetical protein